MIKQFLKQHCYPLVWVKRKIQFGIVDLRHRVNSWIVARRIEQSAACLKGRDKYRVAFLIYNAGEFQFEGLFRLMLKDDAFEPFVVVMPERIAGVENEKRIAASVEILRRNYGDKIHNPLLEEAYQRVDDKCDLVFTSNPYDHNTDKAYRIVHLSKLGVPVVMSNYFYYHGCVYSEESLAAKKYLAYAWRYYAENEKWKAMLDAHQPELRRRNRVRVSGSSKVDLLTEVNPVPHERKRILLCPHHSLSEEALPNYGNFHRYADFMLTLPKRYPQIDWIFRPHPLLAATLESRGYWPEGAWNQYLEKLLANSNVSYQPYGPYWDMFINSDGIIQDCGSFIVEYMFSGHPQCYVIKSMEHMRKQLSDWGLEILSHTEVAESEERIIDYVEKVVLAGKDDAKARRDRFVHDWLLPNYPHASEWILADLKKDLEII